MSRWTGLILAGGAGNRLYPLTKAVNKHLLPVYDKPMIFYPLTTLMLSGVTEFVLISSPDMLPSFAQLLGDGSQWGVSIVYRAQERPGGVAEGFRIAAPDIGGCHVAVVLGDNIFYGSGLAEILRSARDRTDGATVFSYEVADPHAFGIVTLDSEGRAVGLEEKPTATRSRLAVTGIYFYSPDVLAIAAALRPSARGELEITDVNRAYLDLGRLSVRQLGRGIAWLDGGVAEDLFDAGQFVKVIEERTGLKIACPEEIALRLGLVDADAFRRLVLRLPASSYRAYLEGLVPPTSPADAPLGV